jgi:hypothetical protein
MLGRFGYRCNISVEDVVTDVTEAWKRCIQTREKLGKCGYTC